MAEKQWPTARTLGQDPFGSRCAPFVPRLGSRVDCTAFGEAAERGCLWAAKGDFGGPRGKRELLVQLGDTHRGSMHL